MVRILHLVLGLAKTKILAKNNSYAASYVNRDCLSPARRGGSASVRLPMDYLTCRALNIKRRSARQPSIPNTRFFGAQVSSDRAPSFLQIFRVCCTLTADSPPPPPDRHICLDWESFPNILSSSLSLPIESPFRFFSVFLPERGFVRRSRPHLQGKV